MGISGFGAIREMREAIRRFKASGKPVYASLEVATDRDYYLASIADTIAIIPSKSGGLAMLGLGFSSTYLSKTFEKVGLKFNVIHVGDYKGAYENYDREKMSEPLRESLQFLLNDLYRTYVDEIVADRKALDKSKLEKQLLNGDHYLINGEMAVEKGFADLTLDWQELQQRLSANLEFKEVDVSKYIRSASDKSSHKKQIAVLFAEGEIHYSVSERNPLQTTDGIESKEFVHQLRELKENEDVVAVVLRVNSPGGSALASELILQEVKRLKAKKPVVVSMGNVAASGGYYIACEANRIISQPNTVTGSIGVVGMIPTAEGLYKKIEAKVETVEKGKWSKFFRVDKDLTSEQTSVVLDMLTGIYDEFVNRVSDGRSLSVADVERVASGRVWTGTQALERKLVDELGGLDLAITRARELAGVTEANSSVHTYPEPQPWVIALLNELSRVIYSVSSGLPQTPEEREIKQAISCLREFMRERTFVRAYTPLDAEF
jgi:protease-4